MQIDLYDFASLNKTATLIDTKDHTGLPRIDSYTFDGEKMILIACNSNQIFRHYRGLLFIQYCYKGTDKAVRFPSTGAYFL
jgi:dipeptidyl-peptidase-4